MPAQPSGQDLQGTLLGKTSVHLPSAVHSWLLAVEGSQDPGSGLVEVGADTGRSEELAQEGHLACELVET